MTWGALYLYYHCPICNKHFKYGADRIAEFGEEFGFCPDCLVMGVYITEGARIPEDLKYEEVD